LKLKSCIIIFRIVVIQFVHIDVRGKIRGEKRETFIGLFARGDRLKGGGHRK
jgi:hypothetical protein